MITTITFDTLDREAVGRVAARVQIEDVRLGFSKSMRPEPDQLGDGWQAQVRWASRAGFIGWINDPTFGAVAAFRAELPSEASGHEGGGGQPDALADAVFEVIYSVEGGVKDRSSESDLEHFCFLNARFNAWPYWRELVQRNALDMGIGTLIVPVFRVPAYGISGTPQTAGSSKAPMLGTPRKGAKVMAKNTGEGSRKGQVRERSQFETRAGNAAKRDTAPGRIIDVKADKKPFKGVRQEK